MIGYACFQHNGFVWRHHLATLMPASLPHCDPADSPAAIRKIVVNQRAILARWDEGFDQDRCGEWWHIIKDQPEDIMQLSANTRSKIRRGSKKYKCEPVPRDLIAQIGYPVYRDAYARYETFEPMLSPEAFHDAVIQLPEQTEFWAVREITSNQLVAFSENVVRNNACFYLSIWFTPESLRHYSAYLLFHEMNQHYLNARKLLYVSDGARSISHHTNIHDFLETKFGFRKAYSKLRVVYHPLLQPIVTALFPLRGIIAALPGSLFRKMSVVLEQERIRRTCVEVT